MPSSSLTTEAAMEMEGEEKDRRSIDKKLWGRNASREDIRSYIYSAGRGTAVQRHPSLCGMDESPTRHPTS